MSYQNGIISENKSEFLRRVVIPRFQSQKVIQAVILGGGSVTGLHILMERQPAVINIVDIREQIREMRCVEFEILILKVNIYLVLRAEMLRSVL